jgi:hypothetical protein
MDFGIAGKLYPAPLGGWGLDPGWVETDKGWRKKEEVEMEETRIKDLDETRRLCYMALVYSRADGHHELAATLINALLHHQRIDEPQDVVIDLVLDAVNGGEAGMRWVRSQMDRINEELA